MDSDKVIQAYPISKMIKRANGFSFKPVSKNGFFVEPPDILEFDTLPDANNYAALLTQAVSSIIVQFKSNYEQKVINILNA